VKIPYTERLTGETHQVQISETRDEAFALWESICALAETDPQAWKFAFRMHTASDWFIMALALSGSSRVDPFTGRLEIDCDFQFNYCREMQFDGEGVVDYSAREHFKSFWRAYVGVFVETVRNPDITIGLVAHEKEAAGKAGKRCKQEAEENPLLKAAWSDVFWSNPTQESPLWSADSGCLVKRNIIGPTPTWSWWSIRELPTGGRIGLFVVDDVEVEDTTTTFQARETLKQRFTSLVNLGGRNPRFWINGTFHHPGALLASLRDGKAWRMRCHKSEDVSKPAPDIAALYDACGGLMPTRDGSTKTVLPPAVRDVKLDGEPVYLHPLEIALKRLRHMQPGGKGLGWYYMQNFGDPLALQQKRLDKSQLRYYNGPPRERARGANLVMLIDASKGINDRSVALIFALRPDETYSLVGGDRRKVKPSDFGTWVFNLWAAWERLALDFLAIRVEIFGQAVWDTLISTYFANVDHEEVRVEAIGRPANNQEDKGRMREWLAIEPLMRAGALFLPSVGIMVTDDDGAAYNLVEYMVEKEIGEFPGPTTDDCLAALAQLGEPPNPAKGILNLDFPPDDLTLQLRKEMDRQQYGRPYDGGLGGLWA